MYDQLLELYWIWLKHFTHPSIGVVVSRVKFLVFSVNYPFKAHWCNSIPCYQNVLILMIICKSKHIHVLKPLQCVELYPCIFWTDNNSSCQKLNVFRLEIILSVFKILCCAQLSSATATNQLPGLLFFAPAPRTLNDFLSCQRLK